MGFFFYLQAKIAPENTAMDLISSENLDLDLAQLKTSGEDLIAVADFCEMNYVQSEDKEAAYEMTKDYAVQSLASVAYQVNNLAFNFLAALEGTDFELEKLGHSVNHLAQKIKISEEKIARKQIGFLAVSKFDQSQFKIVAPKSPEVIKKAPTRMKKIDFTELDHVGHGVAPQDRQRELSSSLNDSIGNLSISSGASGFSGTLKYRGLHKYKEKYGTTKSTSTLLSRSSLHSLQTLFQKSPRSPIARPTERPPSPPISPRVKVVFPYSPQKHDELNLKEGELITILRKNDDGWWEGVNENGHHGVFPSNYVIQ